jgi:hypothetical protein
MLGIRLYIIAINITLLGLCIAFEKLGLLSGTVITCAALFLILDARVELDELKALESEVASLTQPS